MAGGSPFCHQLGGESNLHSYPVRMEELAFGGSRYRRHMGNHHLERCRSMATLQVGYDRSVTVLNLGIHCYCAAIVDHLFELG